MFEIIKFPYNSQPIARLDANNIVHNHLYHNCPIGNVDNNGFVYKENKLVGKINFKNSMCPKLAGASYLLLIHRNR
ncbi:hypothetical protein QJS64_15815 [Paraclostridium bifermentans]|uniref:Uncharacterized protein n=1 Tax=Paraclostridium bifermentans TaxID=1490 RepID=A0ABY8R1P2_PARBF|nr:hypothetical protein QJS64_15815 [Paraclostridium bifermentans]